MDHILQVKYEEEADIADTLQRRLYPPHIVAWDSVGKDTTEDL